MARRLSLTMPPSYSPLLCFNSGVPHELGAAAEYIPLVYDGLASELGNAEMGLKYLSQFIISGRKPVCMMKTWGTVYHRQGQLSSLTL